MNATSIPLSALPVPDKTRRDQYKRYLVVPPEGGKPVGYTRVTTVAKTLDDGGGLAPWKATMTVCGLLMRRGLRAQWEALMAETGGDPWYYSDDSKADAKRLVKECATVGGADDRRDIGTSLHRIAAMMARGHMPEHLSEETEKDLRAYLQGLIDHGVTVHADLIETIVVLDDWRVAGTFDLATNVPGFELPLIADLKTGASLDYSWKPFAVQLAAYSRANARYVQGRAEDGSEDQRLPLPAFDQTTGLIAWLPAGSAELELHFVDLASGWEGFRQSMWVRNWNTAKFSRPFAEGGFTGNVPDLVPTLEASLAAISASNEGNGATPPPIVDYQEPEPENYNTRLRAWLQGRIDAIGAHDKARDQLMAFWPPNVPPLRASTEHTPEQLDAIEGLCNTVERAHILPFPDPKPEAEDDPVGRLLHLFPNSTIEEQTS